MVGLMGKQEWSWQTNLADVRGTLFGVLVGAVSVEKWTSRACQSLVWQVVERSESPKRCNPSALQDHKREQGRPRRLSRSGVFGDEDGSRQVDPRHRVIKLAQSFRGQLRCSVLYL